MDFKNFIQNLSFRYMQPDHNFQDRFMFYAQTGLSAPIFEIENTMVPENENDYKDRLSMLCYMERMSTYGIACLINKAVQSMSENHCYINVGVWKGFTYFAGVSGNDTKVCIGIDNFTEFGGPRDEFYSFFTKVQNPNTHFYEVDFRDFFKVGPKQKIGVYYYDGAHDYDSQLLALTLAEPFFAEDCVIFVDDTNWTAPRQATLDFINEYSAHSYDVLMDVQVNGEYGLHPTFWNGLMILQRSK
jgi:hypothetical protein